MPVHNNWRRLSAGRLSRCCGSSRRCWCHEPAILDYTGEILVSGIHAAQTSPALDEPVRRAIEQLARSPDQFSAAQFTPLTDEGLSPAQAINLLTWSAFAAG
ncbi:Uncharacterized protein conserved in bacteria [Leclercia adecarboxylata]|uniref:Uncharacterized protein conserved in bacteria n=1 Tax=Leclercia adecarboxylata TaxID=83655 RepID=A0A4U9HYM8_9ENTR|nr:Uncharacterized protein conserved in bacteria [Leclercia adecarboxylata]